MLGDKQHPELLLSADPSALIQLVEMTRSEARGTKLRRNSMFQSYRMHLSKLMYNSIQNADFPTHCH